MATPTSSPSAWSYFWDQYSQAQKDIYEMEQQQQSAAFENIEALGSGGKAAACVTNPALCLEKYSSEIISYLTYDVPKFLAYHGPKTAFETTCFIAKWTGKAAYYIGSSAVNAVKPDFINLSTPQFVEDLYNAAANQAANLSDAATSWVTDLPIPEPILAQTIPLEDIGTSNTTPMDGNFTSAFDSFTNGTRTVEQTASATNSAFQATDLTGPIIAFSICSNRCYKNLLEALHHTRLLVTGQRKVATSYTIPTENSRIPTTISKTKTYTTPRLLKDIMMELSFATLWGAGAYYTYNGMYDNILDASGGNAEHALYVVRKIATMSGVAPVAYEWIKEALYAPASSDSSGQSADAPQSPRTSTRSGIPSGSVVIDIEDRPMSFEEQMDLLGTRDVVIEI